MSKDGIALSSVMQTQPEELYRQLQFNYPKFFKMDLLCKWAWVAAEALLSTSSGFVYDGLDKNKIGLVLATGHGCLEVDKKYNDTIATIPSPALFVYTLSNIMLGEICIRHGFKGEQACMVQDAFDTNEVYFWAKHVMETQGMNACICGWADATNRELDVCLFWVTWSEKGQAFSPVAMQNLYNH